MGKISKTRGYAFEALVRKLFLEADIPCVRPHGSSGASLRAVGLDYSDEVDLITDFQTPGEGIWQLKALADAPDWLYDAPFDPVEVVARSVPSMYGPFDQLHHGFTTYHDVYGGLSVYDSEAHEDYVVLRWPAFLDWLRRYRSWKENSLALPGYFQSSKTRLESVVIDRILSPIKPRPGELGRIVRKAGVRRIGKLVLNGPHYPVAVLTEHTYYMPFGLND